MKNREITTCEGFCARCQTQHSLPTTGAAHEHALQLMEWLKLHKNIDIFSGQPAEEKWSTEPLFGAARGKMFGVLECETTEGTRVFLHGFSGQFSATWKITGWVPPLFDITAFNLLNVPNERRIKKISQQINRMNGIQPPMDSIHVLKKKRKQFSQKLMVDIHQLYNVHNFNNEHATLRHAFLGNGGIPSGTGDCCAPKLLNYAAQRNLSPRSIAEFYWGKENRSKTKKHATFYSSCAGKCMPILGFMLCGTTNRHNKISS